MAERLNATVLKTVGRREPSPGFESPSLRQQTTADFLKFEQLCQQSCQQPCQEFSLLQFDGLSNAKILRMCKENWLKSAFLWPCALHLRKKLPHYAPARKKLACRISNVPEAV